MEGEGCQNAYKYCMRNFAASLGVHMTDGCCQFVALPEACGLLCAACGCHRSFHWKETPGLPSSDPIQTTPQEPITRPRKRERTRFTLEQKERMRNMSESLGWKISNCRGEDEMERFLAETGVSRKVFKVWMHNHRNEAVAASSRCRAVVASSGDTESDGGSFHVPDDKTAIVAFIPAEGMKG